MLWRVSLLNSLGLRREGVDQVTSGLYFSCLWPSANHGLSLEGTCRAMAYLAKQSTGVEKQDNGELSDGVKKKGSWGMEPGFVLCSMNVLTSPF